MDNCPQENGINNNISSPFQLYIGDYFKDNKGNEWVITGKDITRDNQLIISKRRKYNDQYTNLERI